MGQELTLVCNVKWPKSRTKYSLPTVGSLAVKGILTFGASRSISSPNLEKEDQTVRQKKNEWIVRKSSSIK